MDLVSIAMKNKQNKYQWTHFNVEEYQSERYILVDLSNLSDEYSDIKVTCCVEAFGLPPITKIQRIQHAAQLSLFTLTKAKRRNDGEECYKKRGYHLICEGDLETALKYPLDYRRYNFCEPSTDKKQPKIYKSGLEAFNETTYIRENLYAMNTMIVCDVLSYSENEIATQCQGDYLPLYAVFYKNESNSAILNPSVAEDYKLIANVLQTLQK